MNLLALAVVVSAHAYELNGYAWPADEMPLEIHWTGSQPGLSHEEVTAAIEGAAAAWPAAGPCAVSVVAIEDADADAHYAAGGVAVLFGDPDDELEEGVLAVTYLVTGTGETVTWSGVDYERTPPALVVFNDEHYYLSDAAIEAGQCWNQYSLQASITHEIGHVLGLAHSCEQGDACTDSGATVATMYWTLETCDTGKSSLGSDDIDGLAAIYGEAFAFAFTCESAGDDALRASCVVTEPADAASMEPTWDFGDGSTGVGQTVSHTYAAAGSHAVELCLSPPDCAEPRCRTQSVTVGAGDDDVLDDDDMDPDPSGPGCGCDAGRGARDGRVAAMGLAGVLLVARRRVKGARRAGQ